MPSVAEILKQTGFTDEQISALDPRAINAFSGVLTTAEQARQDAATAAAKAEQERVAAQAALEQNQLVQRSNTEFYETKIIPGLTSWEEEEKRLKSIVANKEAEAAFYKAQNEAAKTSGFVPTEAPVFTPPAPQPRNNGGQYVAGTPGGTPGSPTFTNQDIDQRIGSGLSNSVWALQEYQRLTGQFLPDPIDRLAQEADSQKLPFKDYVARKYDFAGKQNAIQLKAQQDHDEQIRKATAAEWETKLQAERDSAAKTLAEKERAFAESSTGNNPDVRPVVQAKMVEVTRAVKEGTRPDPLKLSDHERQNATRQSIRERILERQGTAA